MTKTSTKSKVLLVFEDALKESLSIRDLGRKLDYSYPTLYHSVNELVRAGYLIKIDRKHGYVFMVSNKYLELNTRKQILEAL